MSDARTQLLQAIGQYGAEVSTTGILAPPQYLLDAINRAAPEKPARATKEQNTDG